MYDGVDQQRIEVGWQEAVKIVRKGKVPVVLRRTPFLTSMVAKWDLNYLVRAARAAPCARAPHPRRALTAGRAQCLAFRGSSNTYRVLCADSSKNRFIVTDADKNVFGSYYHVKVRASAAAPSAGGSEGTRAGPLTSSLP